jgi:hypothetical protein
MLPRVARRAECDQPVEVGKFGAAEADRVAVVDDQPVSGDAAVFTPPGGPSAHLCT